MYLLCDDSDEDDDDGEERKRRRKRKMKREGENKAGGSASKKGNDNFLRYQVTMIIQQNHRTKKTIEERKIQLNLTPKDTVRREMLIILSNSVQVLLIQCMSL